MTETVTDLGLSDIVEALVAPATFLGWGSGADQSRTATDLAAALPEARVSGTNAQVTTNVDNDTLRVTGSITATAARAVSEVGLFGDASTASLAVYGSFNPLAVQLGDTVHFTIDVVLEAA